MPFLNSNIHSDIAYDTFYSQLVRYSRLCNNIFDFSARVNKLRNKLCDRGYAIDRLYKRFLKFHRSYRATIKDNEPNAQKLWDKTCSTFNSFCDVNDIKAIEQISKPCKIALNDIRSRIDSSIFNLNKAAISSDKEVFQNPSEGIYSNFSLSTILICCAVSLFFSFYEF